MTKPSRYLLIAMSTSFALCVLGLLAGMLYYLSAVYFAHRPLESVMSSSILYNKALGALGILGMLFFFAFLLSLMSKPNSQKHR
jgi:hypothetical protein